MQTKETIPTNNPQKTPSKDSSLVENYFRSTEAKKEQIKKKYYEIYKKIFPFDELESDESKTLAMAENDSLDLTNDFYPAIKQILKVSKIGETLTKKELTELHNIPKEALNLVKSITKLTKDEIFIRWESTWIIEKISDARFKDDKIKLTFNKDIMHTSGNAIGIKYKKKTHNNLIIRNNKAYIPTVKGFSWQIGK